MQNEKENTQHLDKECVQKVRQIPAQVQVLGLEPRLDITQHLEKYKVRV